MRRIAFLLALTLTLGPATANAQVPDTVPADTAARDSAGRGAAVPTPEADLAEAAGRLDGRLAGARDRRAGTRGDVAFLMGVPVGFLGVLGFGARRPPAAIGSVGGAVLIGALAAGGRELPWELAGVVESRGPDYARGFRRGYHDGAAARRKTAVATGGVLGTAAGVVGAYVLLVLVSSQ